MAEEELIIKKRSTTLRIIIIILVAIGIFLLFPKILGLPQVIKLLHTANPYFLIFAVAAEVISYVGAAFLLKIIFNRLKYRLPFFDLMKFSSIAAFSIHVLPIGGFGEAAIMYYLLRRRGISSGDTLFTFIIRSIFTYVGFFAVFAVGLILLPTHHSISLTQKIISLTLFVALILLIIWLIRVYHDRKHFWQVAEKFLGIVNWFSKKILKRQFYSDSKVPTVIDDIFKGIGLFSSQKKLWISASLAGALYWLGDMFCLYFALLCFGYKITVGGLIFAYCLSFLAGLISFIPGGIGVVEGSLALLLISLGVPSGPALFGVLVFRFISFWILIPVGFWSFLTLKNKRLETK
jgi:uncharacterized protein (TIRG00374 family)